MVLIDYCIQQLEVLFPRIVGRQPVDTIFNQKQRANKLERLLGHFRSAMRAALCFTFHLSIPISDSRRTESRFQPTTLPQTKKLKNRNQGTISKSDTSFCALFQRILLKSGDAYLSIHFDLFGGNHPNIKVR